FRYMTALTDSEEEELSDAEQRDEERPADKLCELLQRIDCLHQGTESDKRESLTVLLEQREEFGQNSPFLWRLIRAYCDVHDVSSTLEEKKTHAESGKRVGEEAVGLNPMCAESHQWYAIMCGIMAEYDTVQNKIKNGYIFKDHLDRAIELKPQDPLSYYLLGRWCYAVAQLSWIERKVAATLFGEPPSATVEDALKNFLKVEEIQPGYSKLNYVFLAKCYKDLGQRERARKMCEAACSVNAVSKEISFIREKSDRDVGRETGNDTRERATGTPGVFCFCSFFVFCPNRGIKETTSELLKTTLALDDTTIGSICDKFKQKLLHERFDPSAGRSIDEVRVCHWKESIQETVGSCSSQTLASQCYYMWKNSRLEVLHLSPEICTLLKQLRSSYKLLLLTNGETQTQREKVEAVRCEEFFDAIVIGGEHAEQKPYLSIFTLCFNMLGVEAQDCVMVGDSLDTDIQGGFNARVRATVWISSSGGAVPESSVKPDYTIPTVLDLPDILEQLK
ncbi:Regulator of microtubule dynamics protein 2, partial [Nibea albiflora]